MPDVNAYSAAFQHPDLCLSDPSLRRCTIKTNPLGQPRVRSGGFALTYNLFNKTTKTNWAVRCFHRESPDRDRRYGAISRRLNKQDIRESDYFVDFEYQPRGITMPNGTQFPIVKMAWATGETMGSFLENRHGDNSALQNLRNSLASLSTFLHSHNIAHGDIQPGNVMVSDMGRKVQLIDYDGMFVSEISGLNAAEIGLPNFQHPERRTNAPWNVNLDNFSFIVIDIALAILQGNPIYWDKTQSGDDKIIFSAQDYSFPDASSVFNELKRDGRYAPLISKLQNICRLPFDNVPRLENFAAWQVDTSVGSTQAGGVATVGYIANYPVVDALRVNDIASQNGNKVEVVGRVVGVKMKNTGLNRPYCFVEFESWRPGMDQSFRFVIWSEGLDKLAQRGINDVDTYFRGKYVSIVGLVEKWVTRIPARTLPARGRWPARTFPERIATAYSIYADGATFNFIDEAQADFRLGRVRQNLTIQHVVTADAPSLGRTDNVGILDQIRRI